MFHVPLEDCYTSKNWLSHKTRKVAVNHRLCCSTCQQICSVAVIRSNKNQPCSGKMKMMKMEALGEMSIRLLLNQGRKNDPSAHLVKRSRRVRNLDRPKRVSYEHCQYHNRQDKSVARSQRRSRPPVFTNKSSHDLSWRRCQPYQRAAERD